MHQPVANLQRFVDRLNLRSLLTDEEQQALLALPVRVVHVRRKHDFVKVGDDSNFAWFVASGLVCRFNETRRGARQIVAFHITGDMVDLQSAARPVSIGGLNALCDTTLLRVPHADIRGLAAQYPGIAEALSRDFAVDTAILMHWIVSVGRKYACGRLAYIFCELAIRFGNDGEPVCDYPLHVTQDQLADAAALTSVHVNRSLKEIQRAVTFKNGIVHISDWAMLASIGEFDPSYLTADIKPGGARALQSAA